MTLFTSVHSAPPLPLRWIFADAKPRSALSRASIFFTDAICPKAPPRARDAARSCLDGDCSSIGQLLVGAPSKHLRDQRNPTQDHQANHREARSERWFLLVPVLLPPPHIIGWSAHDHGQGVAGRTLGFSFFRMAWPPKSSPSAKTRPWRRTLRASAAPPRPASRWCGSPRRHD